MLDEELQEDLRANRDLGVYKGVLYENMVSEALTKQGYKLFYYKRDGSALEEDFFIRSGSSLITIEVKTKSSRAKSMQTLISSDKYADMATDSSCPRIILGTKITYTYIPCHMGITSYTKILMRIATFLGAALMIFSVLLAIFVLISKLLNWNAYPYGSAAILIGVFFISAV